MYNPELSTIITSKISQRIPKDSIIEELISQGWTKDDIEATWKHIFATTNTTSEEQTSSHLPTRNMAIYAISLLIAFVTGAILVVNIPPKYAFTLPEFPNLNRPELRYGSQTALTQANFFRDTKQRFLDERTNFIEADLSAKILRVYRQGTVYLEVPIDTQGKEGSWWETPAGLYKIQNKEDKHFSGIGHVWMPWSMNFQGNFYIHGRTYYPDGTLTSSAYTGGCIRLSTEHAKQVYDAIDIGTPILVLEQGFTSDTFNYDDVVGIKLDSTSHIVADLKNNHILSDNNSSEILPIASITKLMTALITTEYINLDNQTKIPSSALVYTSKPRLKTGDKYSVYQLLFPLLRESSNEAAEAIARHYGRDRFIQHMNNKAKSIGMTHTTFVDPSGAGAGNVSTVADLFMLAKYIYNNRSFIFNVTSGKLTTSAYGTNTFKDLGNFNDFTTHPYFIGGKNGKTTAAQETSLSVLNVPIGTTTRPLVFIILGSPQVRTEGQKLIDHTLKKLIPTNSQHVPGMNIEDQNHE